MLKYLVILGAIVNFAGSAVYIRDTLFGNTKPNRVTRLMWSIAPLIATAAALSEGVTWAVLPVFMSGFLPLLTFIASFLNKNAYWKLGAFDFSCGALSALALILWAITKEPNVAIAFAILSDGLASAPTLVKLWKFPETETGLAYLTGLFSALTSFAAVKAWNFAELAFPIYIVIVCVLLSLAVYRVKILKIVSALPFKLE